ncbi:metallophosphoesterase [Pseudoalteromonas distincta]|uniref:metallophosphoesterase family protein n=1 Tax=Pseudoalteromonas distincta TaxID=77608 RepID=UPI0032184AD8
MDIVHISDPHFSESNQYLVDNLDKFRHALSGMLEKFQDPYLLVTGDITLQGKKEGYDMATKFFNSFIDSKLLKRENFFCCPGNHDIEDIVNPFSAFETFCYSVRRDHKLNFSKKGHVSVDIQNTKYSLLLINSAFHGDHTFGLISTDTLLKLESLAQSQRSWIIATHHHLIPNFEDDISTTRNAYSLLYWAERAKVDLILHGHQHSDLQLTVGDNRVKIKSCRSFSFGSFPIQNGGNIISLKNSVSVKNFTVNHDIIPNKIKFEIVEL